MSKMKAVDLTYFHFIFYFHFPFDLFFIFQFLELRVRVRVTVTSYDMVSYASPPVWKLHPHSDIISKLYKPAFRGGHLSCNMSYGSAATLWVFHLLWWRYSYSTWSSITELLLSVS